MNPRPNGFTMSTEQSKPGTEKQSPMWANLFRRRPDWKQSAIAMLMQTPIFEGIPRKVVGQLVDSMHRRVYSDNEVVFNKGDQGLGMYLVLSGQVLVSLEGAELARLVPGDFFGEIALFGDQARTADAFACGATELVGFFRPDLLEWVERSPKQGSRVLMQLGQVVSERLRASNDRLAGQPI